jgi:DNA-binding transcriptional LysR family regulator
MVFVASNHRLATSRSTSIADLARERWVLGAQVDEPLESLVLAVAQRSGFAPRAVARSDDYRVVAAYVAAGFGVAVMPAGEARLQPPGVTVLLLEDLDMVRSIELLVPETLPTEVVTHLVDAMSGVAQTLRLPQEAQG